MNQKIVAAAFIEQDGKVLLAQRSMNKKIAPGAFHLPGGHVDPGEEVKAALKRELMEELGVVADIGDPYFVFTYETNDSHTVGITFLTKLVPEEQTFRVDPKETMAYHWVAADLVGSFIPAGDHNLQAVKEGFARTPKKSLSWD